MGTEISKIRNFCIIAHIDHGKSTLADRILEMTGAITKRESRDQLMDENPIERERGITIKAKAVALNYKGYNLNLIDTPGHVDFSYEVSRSLAACEGAILLVDATQGVQAQTVANAFAAIENGLEIIPVINKIDMAIARIDETILEMQNTLGIKKEEVLLVSAKEGTGVEGLLGEVISRIPPPKGNSSSHLKALIFDSVYDEYRGVIVYIRMMEGTLTKGSSIRFIGSAKNYLVEEVGIFKTSVTKKGHIQPTSSDKLSAGDVGYIMANIKLLADVRVGDTICTKDAIEPKSLPGYKEPLPVVFAGFYPTNDFSFAAVKKALERLSLNDASFKFQPESSEALGQGFRIGFLGLLHMDIVKERLEREEKVDIIQTTPNVTYEIVFDEGHRGKPQTVLIDNPAKLPQEQFILEWREPIARTNLILPAENIGSITKLCEDRRGEFVKMEYISQIRVILVYDMPFAEIIYDFYDKLKSATRGYGTMDYHITGYKQANLARLRILIGGKEVDALSTIIHKDSAESRGRQIIKTLRKHIARHMFQVALQAAVGAHIVARENIAPMAKHVTGKCYGGDITRKRKLWEKQKEGKKKMKSVGQVDIPQEAFIAVLGGGKGEE